MGVRAYRERPAADSQPRSLWGAAKRPNQATGRRTHRIGHLEAAQRAPVVRKVVLDAGVAHLDFGAQTRNAPAISACVRAGATDGVQRWHRRASAAGLP